MAADYDAVLATPFGALGVCATDVEITAIAFLPPGTPPLAPRNALAALACAQLAAYLADPRAPFDLPLKPAGSEFQRKVSRAITAIPRGRTLSYGEIARRLGSAPRAVGQACGRNPHPVVVPCHRVVAAHGGLGGFAGARDGYLLEAKRWLLEHERRPPGRPREASPPGDKVGAAPLGAAQPRTTVTPFLGKGAGGR